MERLMTCQQKEEIPAEPVRHDGVVINGVTVLELSARKVVTDSRLGLIEHAWDRALAAEEVGSGNDEHLKRMAQLCDLIAVDSAAIDVLLGKRIVIDG